jgi:hypothetical protein
VVKEAQEESKKGEVQKTETKRTFRGRNLKKSPSFFSKNQRPFKEKKLLYKKRMFWRKKFFSDCLYQ